jgi:hypothetical protein
MSLFETLETAIAGAVPADEPALFDRALALFGDASAHHFCRARAFANAAIALHRSVFPNRGYQVGETCRGRGLASTWAKGDAHALPFEAATPGLALLRATAHAAARMSADEIRARCTRCRGRGWIIARDGGKRICGHAQHAAQADTIDNAECTVAADDLPSDIIGCEPY